MDNKVGMLVYPTVNGYDCCGNGIFYLDKYEGFEKTKELRKENTNSTYSYNSQIIEYKEPQFADYYLSSDNVYNRLLEEYHKYGKLIIAVDFDDTIFDFHKKGRLYNDVINLLKQWQDYSDIIVWSGHTEDKYIEIQNYCDKLGLKIFGINCDSVAGSFGRKIYANVYLDDRAGLRETFIILQELIKEVKK